MKVTIEKLDEGYIVIVEDGEGKVTRFAYSAWYDVSSKLRKVFDTDIVTTNV